MPWFGVRTIYHFGQKANGTNVFEERIVSFEAESGEAALRKAELESAEYAAATGMEAFHEREAYKQDGDPLIDGYEVWSALFESHQSLDEFYAARYTSYDFNPE